MAELSFDLADARATESFGASLAPLLRPGDVVCLSGPLGAGKTTFSRGVIAALTGAREAPSPTFALVETYEAPNLTLWHFDLYRLANGADVWELGLEEALASGASLVEWPERIADHIPPAALAIRFDYAGAGRRTTLRAGENWSARLRSAGLFGPKESRNKD